MKNCEMELVCCKTQNQLSDLFLPEEELLHENKLKLFTKRLVAVAISYLLYLRNIFPEVAFGLLNFKDMKLKILQTKTFNNDSAIRFTKNLFMLFEVFDSNRSDEFMLEIVWPDVPENEIPEIYHFKLRFYNGNWELIMCTMDTSVVIKIYEDEIKFIKNMRMLVRNVQIFSQFRNLFPDHTVAKLGFKICCDSSKLDDNTLPEGIKRIVPLPFENFEMLYGLFPDEFSLYSMETMPAMRQLAAIAVSTLLYYRKTFPEEAFKYVSHNKKTALLLHPILWRENESVFQVVDWLLKYFAKLKTNTSCEFVLKIVTKLKSEIYKLKFSNNDRKTTMIFVLCGEKIECPINGDNTPLLGEIRDWCSRLEPTNDSAKLQSNFDKSSNRYSKCCF